MNQKGILIAIEGIDGSGKSTLAKNLFAHLEKKHTVLLTKEPGGSTLGKTIRGIVQQQEMLICPKAEYLLFAADRAQHFQEVIIPALTKGVIVISDRMGDSSVVYQGYARGLDIDMIKSINIWAMQNRTPDITIFVQINPELAYQRLIKRKETLTTFERENETFMKKVDEGFRALYQNRNDVILINGADDEETVLKNTLSALTQRLSQHERI